MDKAEAQAIFDRVAHLARLDPFSPQDRDRMSGEFAKILSLFDVLGQLPSGAPGAGSTRPLSVREDKISPFPPGALVESFPKREGAFLKTPKVIGS